MAQAPQAAPSIQANDQVTPAHGRTRISTDIVHTSNDQLIYTDKHKHKYHRDLNSQSHQHADGQAQILLLMLVMRLHGPRGSPGMSDVLSAFDSCAKAVRLDFHSVAQLHMFMQGASYREFG